MRSRSVRNWASVLVFLGVATLTYAVPARADYPSAKAYFDNLPAKDKGTIVLGVTATGDFQGLIDFGFTKRLYRAIVAFQTREGFAGSGILTAPEAQRLDQIASEFLGKIGAQYVKHPEFPAELLIPTSLFDQHAITEHGLSYEREDKNLSLSFVAYRESEKPFMDLFSTMTSGAKGRSIEYKTLRDFYFVSNGTYRGRRFYTWMSRVAGGSTGFTLSWSVEWGELGSRLSILLANSFAPNGSSSQSEAGNTPSPQLPEQPPSPPNAPALPELSTGTAFVVSSQGHLLTNNHVAGECKTLRVHQPNDVPVTAQLVAQDVANDLALIKAEKPLGTAVASFRAGQAPSSGTDIVVYGFPLSDILSKSGNVVTGNITASAGIGNDSRFYQISAPVQPGNSGGPVYDHQGQIVGIVTARLKPTADNPQNVNFALKSNVAENFLDSAGLQYQTNASPQTLDTPAIASLAQRMTFLVECRN